MDKAQLIVGRKNGYEVVNGGYRLVVVPEVDGELQEVAVFKLPKNTFVTSVLGVSNTDKEVKVKIGDKEVTIASGDSITEVKKSFATEAEVKVTSEATTGEATIVIQTVEYNRTQGTRTSGRI